MRAPARHERVVVLGAGGFLGSHIVPALLAQSGCVVEAVDRTFDKLQADHLPQTARQRLRLTQASIEDLSLLQAVIDRADVVLSLTALCNPALYNKDPLAVIDANYTDLIPIVKMCAAGRRWLVHFSTCEIYGVSAIDGDGRQTSTMNEETSGLFMGPVHKQRWSYATAKQLLERVIWAHGQHRGLPFTIVRPFNVIGPRMDFVPGIDGEGIPRVLANFMGALLRDQPLPLVQGGDQRRSFIYVDDFVNGILAILDRPAACHGEIINLGAPANDISIRQLAGMMGDAYAIAVPGARPRTQDVSADAFYGPGYDDSHGRIPDIDKARRLLDWAPRTGLPQMLPPIIADYLARYRSALPRAAAGQEQDAL